MILGIDFDNTIINYDEIFYTEARERGLIQPSHKRDKKNIRDAIRKIPNGEIEWQKLQACVYGEGIKGAKLVEGVKSFLQACHDQKIKVYIISHKTRYSALDPKQIDLRQAAVEWMERNDFFVKKGLGLSAHQLFFESTRGEKISRIKNLQCTHFIDDLEETFLEESFPQNVEQILYRPSGGRSASENIKMFHSWDQIYEYFFAAAQRQP